MSDSQTIIEKIKVKILRMKNFDRSMHAKSFSLFVCQGLFGRKLQPNETKRNETKEG